MSTGSSSLPLRRFGPTELQVTTLCVGCAPLGDMPATFAYSVGEESALATMRAAFAGPINFSDTAASYGDGESERRIGLVLRELGGLPNGYVLASKADRDLKTGDFSGEQIKRSVERSLRLLGLDQIQIMYLHDPEHTTFENTMSPGGAVEMLHRLKDQGLIKHIGVAGGPTDMEIRYVETGAFEAVITHNRYTLLNRSAEPLLHIAAQRGMAVINAAPYGSGMLAKGPDAYARYAYQDAPAEMVETTRQIQAICERYNVPLAAAALQFSMLDPNVDVTIVGMSKPERVQQTIDLATIEIPPALWDELRDLPTYDDDPELYRWKASGKQPAFVASMDQSQG
jgi:D-threo-aldose 1-dehydrogenase